MCLAVGAFVHGGNEIVSPCAVFMIEIDVDFGVVIESVEIVGATMYTFQTVKHQYVLHVI